MKSRDSKKRQDKRAERQIQTAGRFPYHRVGKIQKMLHRIAFWKVKKDNS